MDYYEKYHTEHCSELEKEKVNAKYYVGTGAGIVIHKELNYAIPFNGCAYCCRDGMKRDIMVMSYIDGYFRAKGEKDTWENHKIVRDTTKIKNDIYDVLGVEDKTIWS